MNVIKSILLICTLTFFLDVMGQDKNSNYISLDFTYEHLENPIPTLIFYVDSFRTGGYPFLEKRFKIERNEFDAIENIVFKNSSYIIIDSLATRYYDIHVVKNGNKVIYGQANH